MVSGRYIDITVGIDWFTATLQTNVFALLVSNPKIPYTDQGAAVVVFANLDGSDAPELIANQIAPLLVTETEDSQREQALQQARQIFDELVEGKIDRGLLTSNADAYFTRQVLDDASASLKTLGAPEFLRQISVVLRGGMTYRHFVIRFKNKSLHLSTLTAPDGKLEQYLIQ
jgi:hypothetical protein